MNILKILYILLVINYVIISYQDWSSQKFSSILLIWPLFFLLFLIYKDFLLVKNFILSGSLGFGIPFLLSKWTKKSCLGKGDLYILAISGMWIPWVYWPSIFVFIGVFGLIWGLIYHWCGRKAFPFTPLIIAATLPYLWLYCWGNS